MAQHRSKQPKDQDRFFIPETGKNVMRAVVNTPKKTAGDWKYLKRETLKS